MAKTQVKPWSRENVFVGVESKDVLSKDDEKALIHGIRIAFSWCFVGEPWPSCEEIKQAIEDFNPELAKKIISITYIR